MLKPEAGNELSQTGVKFGASVGRVGVASEAGSGQTKGMDPGPCASGDLAAQVPDPLGAMECYRLMCPCYIDLYSCSFL